MEWRGKRYDGDDGARQGRIEEGRASRVAKANWTPSQAPGLGCGDYGRSPFWQPGAWAFGLCCCAALSGYGVGESDWQTGAAGQGRGQAPGSGAGVVLVSVPRAPVHLGALGSCNLQSKVRSEAFLSNRSYQTHTGAHLQKWSLDETCGSQPDDAIFLCR